MKLSINQEIRGGRYYVQISVLELSDDERERILKFGAPMISIEPQVVLSPERKRLTALPLHQIDRAFVFLDEESAKNFSILIKERVKEAIHNLKSIKDDFSKNEEYEI
jgi:DNA primase catalytic subunit